MFIPWASSVTDMMCYQNKGVFYSISWNFLISLMNGKHLFKSRTDNISLLELPNTENVSLSEGYAKLFFSYPYV